MKKFKKTPQGRMVDAIRRCLCITPLLLGATFTDVQALSLTVQSGDPLTPFSNIGYRYMIQEDRTFDSIPGTTAVVGTNLSLGFHNSQSPVVANGHSDTATVSLDSLTVDVEDTAGNITQKAVTLDPTKRYFVSILPDQPVDAPQTFAMAAGELPTRIDLNPTAHTVLDTAGTTTIIVQPQPIPTAQISLFVHEDNQPINNTPDLPGENGLAGFNVRVFDAGGGYGAVGGQMSTDAFGNPLGSTYLADGTLDQIGTGSLTTGADGTLLIKYLAPGKYTVFVDPPNGLDCYANSTPVDGCYAQTATIEGTRGNDAWVKANEPSFFAEFGPPGHHVFIGFVKKGSGSAVNPAAGALNGGVNVTGQIVNNHISRPPNMSFFDGGPVDGCWVGVNDVQNGNLGVYSGPCDATSNFDIPGLLPDHLYELAVWDKNLDRLFAARQFTTPAAGNLSLGTVPVFDWFSHVNHTVFNDLNENGFQDTGEAGLANIAANLRFRDGRIYQSNVTDTNGRIENPEVFPFFSWQIAEVDFARYKATGVTTVTDAGGIINQGAHTIGGFDFTYGGLLEPQLQTAANEGDPLVDALATWNVAADAPCRTVLPQAPIGGVVSPCVQAVGGAPVLLQSIQAHMGLTTEFQWGKKLYGATENGGITGITHYATTRAEDLARNAAPDNWEPGIPHVQVALYQDKYNNTTGVLGADKVPDHFVNGVVTPATPPELPWVRADVDNYPQGNFPGPEDVDRGTLGIFDYGDAINIASTDAFDDHLPVGCSGDNVLSAIGIPDNACFDGLRPYQQTRDGVFDGGYGFFEYVPGGIATGTASVPLSAGFYIVENPTPPGYQIQMNEDKNVGFGDGFNPGPLAQNLDCVGDVRTLPTELSLFPGTALDPSVALYDVDTATAGIQIKQCDMKQVQVRNGNAGTNAAADFYMFTEVPAAANVTGIILDDLANTINPNSPAFGEKYAPPHLPVSFRDWKGNEVMRVYSDQNGTYNALLPSTYNANVPNPSGYSPNMLTACMNDPGPITRDPTTGATIAATTDPFFDRRYSQFCYTFQYMPGSTTHLDTPVLPVAAFAGPSPLPVDCEQENQRPAVYSVTNGANGPWVPAAGGSLTIVSQGNRAVTNPAYQQLLPASATNPKTIIRDFGFGGAQGTGTVRLGDTLATVTAWTNDSITITVPNTLADGEYQLSVTRGSNGKTTEQAVTVTKGGSAPITVAAGGSIQGAIEAAPVGSLITVAPGTYSEFVVMAKQVRLQGWGPATVINAAKGQNAERLQAWRDLVWHTAGSKFMQDPSILLPGQAGCPVDANGDPIGTLPTCLLDVPNNEPSLFGTGEAPGVIVLASDPAGAGPNKFVNNTFANGGHARIDGFTITNADTGGGIFLNAYAKYVEIGNNVITANVGTYGGGIRSGHPDLTAANANNVVSLADAQNDKLNIHHNAINQNGNNAPTAVGGGVALYTGSNDYTVADNQICGNFSQGNGGGFGQLGLARNLDGAANVWGGLIQRNKVLFNQSFQQQAGAHGGGLYIAGQPSPAGGLSEGSGSIQVSENLIQGNQAGAGSGAGIRAENVNGTDVSNASVNDWYRLLVANNIIVNNSAGLAGGGISLKDVARSSIVYNTIANNDSTATAAAAFAPGDLLHSQNQPAGLAFEAHSGPLDAAMSAANLATNGTFARPVLQDNIIWQNRSFQFSVLQVAGQFDTFELLPLTAPWTYWDFGVPPGNALSLSVTNSVVTAGSENCPAIATLSTSWRCDSTMYPVDASNSNSDPLFVSDYVNRDPSVVGLQAENPYAVGVALDEGGNQVDARFGPLTRWLPGTSTLYGDYHITTGSVAKDTGTSTGDTTIDIDGGNRPFGPAYDKGADEFGAAAGGGGGGVVDPVIPALAVLDNYNRANANTLGGQWRQLIALANAGIRVNGNQAFCVNNGIPAVLCAVGANAYWAGGNINNTFGASQAAAFTFANATVNNNALILKANGTYNAAIGTYQSHIRVQYNNGNVTVATSTNFIGYTTAGTINTGGNLVNGNRLTARVDNTGKVFVWKTVGAITTYLGTVTLPNNALWTTGVGKAGIQLASGARVDNFAAGNAP